MIMQGGVPKPRANTALEEKRMSKAVTNLVLNHPFFAFIAMRLKRVPSSQYPALATDGRTLWFNPEYTSEHTDAELIGALAHCTLHIANGHPWRGVGRDESVWNDSCDNAINPVLEQSYFQLPDDHAVQDRFIGKSAEACYLVLLEEALQRQKTPNDDGNDPGSGDDSSNGDNSAGNDPGAGNSAGNNPGGTPPGCGQVVVPQGSKSDLEKLETDWSIAIEQAYQYAKGRGALPSGAELLVQNLKKAQIDWKAELRRYMQQAARNDYSWSRPNPRYASSGLYLPDLRNEETGDIIVALDTSGSTFYMVEEFVAELNEILLEVQPKSIHVLHIDAELHHVDIFEKGDVISSNFTLHGGGGTRFEPAFEYAEKLDSPPACLVYLTDLWGSFPDSPPDYPVVWAATAEGSAPFGDIVPLNLGAM
jgi:predicted metal-dependent peptidase